MKYTLAKPLPPCMVDAKCLDEIERFIKQMMNDLAPARDESELSRRYQVNLVEGGQANLEVRSVEDLPPEPWPEKTKEIRMWGYVTEHLADGFSMRITFAATRGLAGCEITLKSDDARERVHG